MWKGANGVLKFGEIFYQGVPESDIAGSMIFGHGKGRKFRVVIKKDTFPRKRIRSVKYFWIRCVTSPKIKNRKILI